MRAPRTFCLTTEKAQLIDCVNTNTWPNLWSVSYDLTCQTVVVGPALPTIIKPLDSFFDKSFDVSVQRNTRGRKFRAVRFPSGLEVTHW